MTMSMQLVRNPIHFQYEHLLDEKRAIIAAIWGLDKILNHIFHHFKTKLTYKASSYNLFYYTSAQPFIFQ